jgi:hypothetical protein
MLRLLQVFVYRNANLGTTIPNQIYLAADTSMRKKLKINNLVTSSNINQLFYLLIFLKLCMCA